MDRIRMNEMLAKLSLSDPINLAGKENKNTTRGEKAGRGGAGRGGMEKEKNKRRRRRRRRVK